MQLRLYIQIMVLTCVACTYIIARLLVGPLQVNHATSSTLLPVTRDLEYYQMRSPSKVSQHLPCLLVNVSWLCTPQKQARACNNDCAGADNKGGT